MITRRANKNLVWVELRSPSQEEVRSIVRQYDVHPLVGDELLSPSARQKTERYGDFLYLVLNFPTFGAKRQHVEQELDIIVGKQLFITATYEEVAALRSFAQAFETASVLDHGTMAGHSAHMLHLMLSKLYRNLLEEVEYIREELKRIEGLVFAEKERQMVVEISRASRIVLDFRRTLAPHQEILSSLESVGGRLFGQEFGFYTRLLQSEYLKVQSGLDELRDSLQELRETNNSLLSAKQNEVMKTLTVMAFIALPLSFIADIFTMNTRYTPLIGIPYDFWILLGAMLAVAFALLAYFKYHKWL